jgi:hypothetical protein
MKANNVLDRSSAGPSQVATGKPDNGATEPRGPARWVGWLAGFGRGQGPEFWIALLFAVGVATLKMFGLVNLEMVLATVLGTLSLLAWGALGNRRELSELRAAVVELSEKLNVDRSSGVAADRFFLTDMTEFSEHLARATDIRLLGVTLSRMLARCGAELARRLRAGARIRVIILDPDGPGIRQAGLRLPVGAEDYFEQRLEVTIKQVKTLKMRYGQGELDVRLVPGVPPVAMSILDPESPLGRLYVEIYATEWLRDHPVFCLHARRDGQYFHDYLEQFETLWESARPLWPVPEGT